MVDKLFITLNYPAVGFVDIVLLEDVCRDKTNDETNQRKRHSETTQLTKIESDVASLLQMYVTTSSVLAVAIRRRRLGQVLVIFLNAGHFTRTYLLGEIRIE